ncbi:glycosyltransferase family 9 protein [Leptolyngbya sp. KIOST-1]|uniref:glycosyltransferase family 9 protein n=1 Tax=Leptolyngbya sp. KIOST-1 TaxID=1229172 RepID=UPI00056BF37D|nr:glycosyltransferase family 9 protein [Leptolyngbya sp. KIOST-1]
MTRILFIELLGGLGDVLIALPAIQALAASHAPAHTTVLTFAPGDELLAHHPLVQQVWRAAPGQARRAVEPALQTSFDLIVTDTTYDGIADLVEQSGAGRTVTNLWRSPPGDQLVSDRMVQILQSESLITPEAAQTHRHPRLYLSQAEQTGVQTRLKSLPRPRIGLYTDAGMAIKQWAPDRFVALGKLLQQRHGAHLIVPTGADPQQAQTIVEQLETATLWPRGPLRELAALFAQLDVVVAADTGPARIAAAVGTPTITLFGPSWAGRYGQPAPHRNLQGYPPCPERNIANFTEQACWYSGTCPFAWDTCVNLLSPEVVAEAVGGWESGRVDGWGSGWVDDRETDELYPHPPTRPPAYPPTHPPIHPSTHPPFSHPPFSPCRNLLILRPDNIGDVLMTAPALRAIKETQPDTRLTLLASPAGSLAAAVLPWVDEVITHRTLWQALDRPPGDPEQEWQLIETLKARQFDGAIALTSFKQSPHPAALICQLAGIPLRLGASKETGECLTHRVSDLPDDLHQVERNLRLVKAAGYQVRDRHLSLTIPPSPHLPAQPYLLLNPWASCPSRMYDLERFAIAARTLAETTNWPVVVTGTDKHRAAAAPLLDILGLHAMDLVGKTTLPDLVALVAKAQLMLSTNTSTMHIADATQTPSVILFAGTELERQWQPRQTRARLLRRPTPCSPCYAFTCPYHMECLDIPPTEVVTAALSLLDLPDHSISPSVGYGGP